MKNLIAIAVLFIAASFCFNSDTFAQDERLPILNVKVYEHLSTTPAEGVLVEYKQNGVTVFSAHTDGNGMVYTTAATGYYDIYAWRPDPPNDTQSSQKLGHFHNAPEVVELTLSAWY